METVGSFEAKTHLPELVRRVEPGKRASNHQPKHGQARSNGLGPPPPLRTKPDVKQAVDGHARVP